METWLKISLLLCTFGFFREFRPSEPFVTEYLSGDYRNLTSEQINKEVYPFGTYSVLTLLVLVFLVTDLLRYKPIIVASAIAGIVLFAMLLWTRTVLELQIAQVFYGLFMAAEVAYYTYMYAKVDRDQYQIVTGHVRAAILSGKFLGGVIAQILVSAEAMSFRGLHYISLATQVISLTISLLLPKVPRSLYFYAIPENKDDVLKQQPIINEMAAVPKFSLKNAIRLFCYHLTSSYTNPVVLLWSIWWSFATCGQITVITYIQFLWKDLAPNNRSNYNGGVEAIATLLGAVGAIAAGMLNSNKRRSCYMLVNSTCSVLLGALLLLSAITGNILLAYISYAIFCAVFYFMITVAAAIVAENLVDDSFGLIFGINMLGALIIQTLLTVVVVTDAGYGLPPRDQYTIYGFYFVVLGISFYIILLFQKLCSNKQTTDSIVN